MIDADPGKPTVLVWQMGKVASTSIHQALVAAGIPTVKVHTLNRTTLARRREQLASAGHPPSPLHDEGDALEPIISNPNAALKVVSAVRDPVARNLARLFQGWNALLRPPPSVDVDDPDQVCAWFIRGFDHAEALTWFEREIQARTGVDVYRHAIEPVGGAARITSGRLDLLVLRCEDDNRIKEEALNNFLHRTDLRIATLNRGRDKPEGSLYEQVRQRLRLPGDLLSLYYDSRLVRRFYTDEEVIRFRRSWTDPDTSPVRSDT